MPLNRPLRGLEGRRRHALALASATAVLGLAPATALADTAVQAESFSLSPSSAGQVLSDSSASGGKLLKIWSNAYASKSFTTADASGYLVVRARGSQCSGAPQVSVEVNGTRRLTATVSATSWTSYGTAVSLPKGTHSIKLRYANDYRSSQCDRNLFVDSVVLKSAAVTTATPTPTPTPTPTATATPTPTPTATPAPTTSGQTVVSGRLIKQASFENTTSEVALQQAVVGRISPKLYPAVHGSYSMGFEVRNGDRWGRDIGKNRSEALLQADRGYAPREGDDYWHRWWMRIPASTPLPTDAKGSIHLTQTNSGDHTEHLAGFTFRSTGLTFDNDGGNIWTLPKSQFQTDRWYKVLWHSHWSKDPAKGYDELWIDDVKVGMKTAKTLSDTGNYMKFGLYRMDLGQGTANVYFDGLRIATTRAMAEAG